MTGETLAYGRAAKTRRSRGQGLVEFALIVPIVLLLLLVAIDFGRAYVGWITLNNMARVGANYAAQHPDAWATNNTAQLATYNAQIDANKSGINCTEKPRQPPVFGTPRTAGSTATVKIECTFSPATPLISVAFPGGLSLAASSVFPITSGCISNCSAVPGPSPTPPPPPADNCRTVPDMTNLSVAGARRLWAANGFSATNFLPAPGSDDSRTVTAQSVTPPPSAEPCTSGEAFFSSSVTVTLKDLVTPKPTVTCLYVPNMLGMTVAEGRTAWSTAGFATAFRPATGQDDQIIDSQTTTPPSAPGECLEPDATADVTYVAPPPPPPAAPCLVPSLVNTQSGTATGTWTGSGFAAPNLTFQHQNQLPYTIKAQSLVGGTYTTCSAVMRVDNR